MKFLVILLLCFCKCFSDDIDTGANINYWNEFTFEPELNNEITNSSTTATTSDYASTITSTTKLLHQPVTVPDHYSDVDTYDDKMPYRPKTTPGHDPKPSHYSEAPPYVAARTAEPCPPPPDGICLSTPAIYLIASSIVLMFIIIIYLVYALQKSKSSGYKYIANETSSAANKGGGYNRQESQEQTTPTITPLDGIKIDDTYFKHTSSVRDASRNITTPTTSDGGNSKVIRNIKNGNPQTNLILREQIKEICQGVLNNPITLKSRDARDFLLEIEGLQRRPSHKRLTREKSASTPQLDIYDTVPARCSNDSISSIDNNKLSQDLKPNKKTVKYTTDSKTHKTTQQDDDEIPIYDNPPINPEPCDNDDMPVYDSLPSSSSQPPKITINGFETGNRPLSKKSVVEDTDNSLILDFDYGKNNPKFKTDPTYTNAKTHDFML